MSNIAICLCGRIRYGKVWIGLYPELVMKLMAQEVLPEVVDCDRCANEAKRTTVGALMPTLGKL